jgi:hypothetical protein
MRLLRAKLRVRTEADGDRRGGEDTGEQLHHIPPDTWNAAILRPFAM